MSTHLADGNLLIALTVSDHVHHRAALKWFEATEPDLATCPITEGTLVRFLLREGLAAVTAVGVLDGLRTQPWHRFWPADLPLTGELLGDVVGHRQVTDAYLLALAIHHGGRLVTFDRGLAMLGGSVVTLLDS